MATGQTLAKFHPYLHTGPTTNYGTLSYRNRHPHLEFATGTDEAVAFDDVLVQHYDGGGITAYVWFSMASAITGNVAFEIAFERIGEVLDIDADSFATVQSSGAVAVPGTSGILKIATVAFTNSEIDGLLKGELYRMKINRDVGVASNAAGDAEVHFVELRET